MNSHKLSSSKNILPSKKEKNGVRNQIYAVNATVGDIKMRITPEERTGYLRPV